MTERIKLTYRRKRYVVVRDKAGVIRVEYINSVTGKKNLKHEGQIWRKLAAAYPAAFNLDNPDTAT